MHNEDPIYTFRTQYTHWGRTIHRVTLRKHYAQWGHNIHIEYALYSLRMHYSQSAQYTHWGRTVHKIYDLIYYHFDNLSLSLYHTKYNTLRPHSSQFYLLDSCSLCTFVVQGWHQGTVHCTSTCWVQQGSVWTRQTAVNSYCRFCWSCPGPSYEMGFVFKQRRSMEEEQELIVKVCK